MSYYCHGCGKIIEEDTDQFCSTCAPKDRRPMTNHEQAEKVEPEQWMIEAAAEYFDGCPYDASRKSTVSDRLSHIIARHAPRPAPSLVEAAERAAIEYFKTPTQTNERQCFKNVILKHLAGQTQQYQEQTKQWMIACFGEQASSDLVERRYRFLEESLELIQACGCTKQNALTLVDYVFSRNVGEKSQEVGGVLLTLSALCNSVNIDMKECGDTELKRVWVKIDDIRKKHFSKPRNSPLPQSATPPTEKGE